ncbi:MAG: hypothetical protein AAGJ38_02960 [Planctomycetota bacterium]
MKLLFAIGLMALACWVVYQNQSVKHLQGLWSEFHSQALADPQANADPRPAPAPIARKPRIPLPDRPRVAILDWATDSTLEDRQIEAIHAAWRSELEQSDHFEWIDRDAIVANLDELTRSALLSESDGALQLGQWVGADLLVHGTHQASPSNPHDVVISIVDMRDGGVLQSLRYTWTTNRSPNISDWAMRAIESLRDTVETDPERIRQTRVMPLVVLPDGPADRGAALPDFVFESLRSRCADEPNLRWLTAMGTEDSALERRLAVNGLTQGAADAWTQIAETYVWGAYRELPSPAGQRVDPAELSIELTLNAWSGQGEPLMVTRVGTLGALQKLADDAADALLPLLRKPIPGTIEPGANRRIALRLIAGDGGISIAGGTRKSGRTVLTTLNDAELQEIRDRMRRREMALFLYPKWQEHQNRLDLLRIKRLKSQRGLNERNLREYLSFHARWSRFSDRDGASSDQSFAFHSLRHLIHATDPDHPAKGAASEMPPQRLADYHNALVGLVVNRAAATISLFDTETTGHRRVNMYRHEGIADVLAAVLVSSAEPTRKLDALDRLWQGVEPAYYQWYRDDEMFRLGHFELDDEYLEDRILAVLSEFEQQDRVRELFWLPEENDAKSSNQFGHRVKFHRELIEKNRHTLLSPADPNRITALLESPDHAQTASSAGPWAELASDLEIPHAEVTLGEPDPAAWLSWLGGRPQLWDESPNLIRASDRRSGQTVVVDLSYHRRIRSTGSDGAGFTYAIQDAHLQGGKLWVATAKEGLAVVDLDQGVLDWITADRGLASNQSPTLVKGVGPAVVARSTDRESLTLIDADSYAVQQLRPRRHTPARPAVLPPAVPRFSSMVKERPVQLGEMVLHENYALCREGFPWLVDLKTGQALELDALLIAACVNAGADAESFRPRKIADRVSPLRWKHLDAVADPVSGDFWILGEAWLIRFNPDSKSAVAFSQPFEVLDRLFVDPGGVWLFASERLQEYKGRPLARFDGKAERFEGLASVKTARLLNVWGGGDGFASFGDQLVGLSQNGRPHASAPLSDIYRSWGKTLVLDPKGESNEAESLSVAAASRLTGQSPELVRSWREHGPEAALPLYRGREAMIRRQHYIDVTYIGGPDRQASLRALEDAVRTRNVEEAKRLLATGIEPFVTTENAGFYSQTIYRTLLDHEIDWISMMLEADRNAVERGLRAPLEEDPGWRTWDVALYLALKTGRSRVALELLSDASGVAAEERQRRLLRRWPGMRNDEAVICVVVGGEASRGEPEPAISFRDSSMSDRISAKLLATLSGLGVDLTGDFEFRSEDYKLTADLPHLAAMFGRPSTLQVFLDLGWDPEAKTDGVRAVDAALVAACQTNSLSNALALLGLGASPNAIDADGVSALNAAVKSTPDIFGPVLARALIDAGADPTQPDGRGRTSMQYAIDEETRDMLRSATAGNRSTDGKPSPWLATWMLHRAIDRGDDEEIRQILESGQVEMDSKDRALPSPLFAAVRQNRLDLYAELLDMYPPGKEQRRAFEGSIEFAVRERHDRFVFAAIALDRTQARGLMSAKAFLTEIRSAARKVGRRNLLVRLPRIP